MSGTPRRRELTDPDWLSVTAVAIKLDVSTWQVRKWLEADKFDEIVVFSPRLLRISVAAVDRFIAKNIKRAS